jgi:hypothetical protein
LKRNFTASAMKCVMPQSFVLKSMGRFARFGPRRSCIIADCRRSSQVRIEATGMRKPRIMKAIFATPATIVNPSSRIP